MDDQNPYKSPSRVRPEDQPDEEVRRAAGLGLLVIGTLLAACRIWVGFTSAWPPLSPASREPFVSQAWIGFDVALVGLWLLCRGRIVGWALAVSVAAGLIAAFTYYRPLAGQP